MEVKNEQLVIISIENLGNKDVGIRECVHPYVISLLKIIKKYEIQPKGFHHPDPESIKFRKMINGEGWKKKVTILESNIDLIEEVDWIEKE